VKRDYFYIESKLLSGRKEALFGSKSSTFLICIADAKIIKSLESSKEKFPEIVWRFKIFCVLLQSIFRMQSNQEGFIFNQGVSLREAFPLFLIIDFKDEY